MIYFLLIFLPLWIVGWIATCTSCERSFVNCLMLFFIWPYIAWCIADQGDI